MPDTSDKGSAYRRLLFAGIAGPVLFGAVVAVAGALRPGYDHANQFISELGEAGAEFAWLMNYFGFMLSAVFIGLFALALSRRFRHAPATISGSLLLAVFAVCLFLAGVYSCDAGCSPTDASSEQVLHDLVSVVAFPAFALAVAIWGFHFLRRPTWRGFGLYSIGTVVLSIALLVLMVQSEASRDSTGVYQRLFLGVLFVWMIALSLRLRVSRDVDSAV